MPAYHCFGPQFTWTEEAIAKLRHLASTTTMSCSEMASEIGTTRNSVIGKLNRLGGYKRRQKTKKEFVAKKVRDIVTRPKKIIRPHPWRKYGPSMPGRALAEPACEPLPSTAVSLWELTARCCRWPLWGGETAHHEKFYCGGASVEGMPYCDWHCRIAYTPARKIDERGIEG